MTHRFPIKEIARQAGLGTATVDRAINGRANVSPQTRQRVSDAIAELTAQEGRLSARGRRMFFDFVTEAPTRFSREICSAVGQVVAGIGTAVCRPRFVTQEIMTGEEVVTTLNRIAGKGSQGVCLKARDLPEVRAATDRLMAAGIPVITLVTDVQAGRLAYAGLDNQAAGRTAAYLIAQSTGSCRGTILTTKSQDRFLGEEERATAFTETLQRTCPDLRIIDASGGSGVAYETARLVEEVADRLTDLRGVYSMGGGNRSVLSVLARHNLRPGVYIAHDLDRENRALLAAGQLSFVLHHDLVTDIQHVFQQFLHYHKLLPAAPAPHRSNIVVITPHNIPPARSGGSDGFAADPLQYPGRDFK